MTFDEFESQMNNAPDPFTYNDVNPFELTPYELRVRFFSIVNPSYSYAECYALREIIFNHETLRCPLCDNPLPENSNFCIECYTGGEGILRGNK